MSVNPGLFSSASDEWETPQELFDELKKEFDFKVDVCATAENTKCNNFFDISTDGLEQPWHQWGTCWMNPPYGRKIGRWVKKAYEESQKGATVVCLLPARTDTAWFHDYCLKGEIRWIRGRLKFGGSKNSAPFPSMVVIFRSPEGGVDSVKNTCYGCKHLTSTADGAGGSTYKCDRLPRLVVGEYGH
jgi:phage N-6-adenine-methyltransferase